MKLIRTEDGSYVLTLSTEEAVNMSNELESIRSQILNQKIAYLCEFMARLKSEVMNQVFNRPPKKIER